MWRVSIEAGDAYSRPHLIPGDDDGRAGFSTGDEFFIFYHNLSISIYHSTWHYTFQHSIAYIVSLALVFLLVSFVCSSLFRLLLYNSDLLYQVFLHFKIDHMPSFGLSRALLIY